MFFKVQAQTCAQLKFSRHLCRFSFHDAYSGLDGYSMYLDELALDELDLDELELINVILNC